MKRLVWLLLAVVGTALAQVQPVALPETRQSCHCCEAPGSCGRPGCLPPPVSALTISLETAPARTVGNEARRITVPIRRCGEKFFAAFVRPAAVSVATLAPDWVPPPVRVPLFAAHCSFLI